MTCYDCERLKDNVDSHIKELKRRTSDLEDLPQSVYENVDNIQHCYELIYELRDIIEKLKQEINDLKLIQIINFSKKQTYRLQKQSIKHL